MKNVHVYRERDKWVIENCLGTSISHRHFLTTFIDSSVTGLPGCTDKKILSNRRRATLWQKKHPKRYKVRYRNWRKSNLVEKREFDRWYRSTHKELIRFNNRRWKKFHPTYTNLRSGYDNIRQRCNNPFNSGYKWYGGKGIKCSLTWPEYLFLWRHDKAYRMQRPTIDRVDPQRNYSIRNCRFIEQTENSYRSYHSRGGVHPTFWEKVKLGLITIIDHTK